MKRATNKNGEQLFLVMLYSESERSGRYIADLDSFEHDGFPNADSDEFFFTKTEADELIAKIDNYVHTSGKYNEDAIWAWDHKEWGVYADEFYVPDEDAE